ncbi:alpha/beta fold hydrolase [Pareuzebyella sediminis]|uniref:alpha/beta fold hydrolase n=1 Tax=Pareuzebyella sediminis TaxID=2607998 RepID=UPI0011EBF461
MKSLKIPVLLLKGDLSPDWFGAVANELHRLLPLSELITIENSSHGLYFEQPEAVDKAVMEFLENH